MKIKDVFKDIRNKYLKMFYNAQWYGKVLGSRHICTFLVEVEIEAAFFSWGVGVSVVILVFGNMHILLLSKSTYRNLFTYRIFSSARMGFAAVFIIAKNWNTLNAHE